MKRLTKKPWFGKKYFGWGLRPVSREGWLVTFVFILIIIINAFYFRNSPINIIIFIVAIVAYILTAILTGDKPGSIVWEKKEKRPLLILVYVLMYIVILSITFLSVYQIHRLKVAHSTFENYSTFRGCIELIEKTDTYGICKLSSGQIIKLVKYQDKWYLDGDLPHPGLNFL